MLSLSSHGAAVAGVRPAAVFSDYLHLLAAGFWVGGLFHFALGLPMLMRSLAAEERRSVLAALAPRFSTLATLSVGTLIITGIYSGWAQVTVISAVATPYGFTLLAKLGLVAPLLLLGAFNLLWVRPRLAKEERAGRRLRRFVTGEAILAILVLLAVGLLTSLEPARQVASRQAAAQQSSLVFRDLVERMRITLRIEPAQAGVNKVEVSLVDVRGTPVTNPSDVSLRLKYLNADLGEDPATAVPVGEGKYVLEKALLAIAGPWQVELVVRRPDAFDARTAFRFNVALGAGPTGPVITPSAKTGKLLWGMELVLLGFLFLGVGIPLGGWRSSRSGAGVMGVGAAAVLAGLFLLVTTQLTGITSQQTPRNPFPPNPKSLNVGQRLYQQNCQICHGVTGRGDGPLAAGLKPPPLDLIVHVPLHSEEALFRFIRDGIPGTAMQPWRDRLSEEEIWHVVNYLRTLAERSDR
jgi:copper transport protein